MTRDHSLLALNDGHLRQSLLRSELNSTGCSELIIMDSWSWTCIACDCNALIEAIGNCQQ